MFVYTNDYCHPSPSRQLSALCELERDLRLEIREHKVPPPSHLQLYLAVSKLLNTAWSLPSDFLPHFQLYVRKVS